jgi:hypothetical protein
VEVHPRRHDAGAGFEQEIKSRIIAHGADRDSDPRVR